MQPTMRRLSLTGAGALEGMGMPLPPTFMLSQHIHGSKLVPLLADFRAPETGIDAVYPSRTHLLANIRASIDFLVQAFAQIR